MARRAAKPTKTTTQRSDVEIRLSKDFSIGLTVNPSWGNVQHDWSYVVQTRRRWRDAESASQLLFQRCRDTLIDLGVKKEDLTRLANADVIEVSVLYTEESVNWAARTMPWEFLISGAIQSVRRTKSTIVLRHLERSVASNRSSTDKPSPTNQVLTVCSMPGRLGDIYDVSRERQLPSLKLKNSQFGSATEFVFGELHNPTLAELGESLKKIKPRILHYIGVDTHQGAELLDIPFDPHRLDGLMLSSKTGDPVAVNVDQLVNAISNSPPSVVVYNAQYSASRIAARTVAAGAEASIGFQDKIDDRLAEMFVSDFYRLYSMSDGDSQAAFIAALSLQRGYEGDIRGSGIVLWHAIPVFSDGHGDEVHVKAKRLLDGLSVLRQKPFESDDIRSVVSVEVRPRDRLNYSLLHNRESLFNKFRITKNCDQRIDHLHVQVELQVGSERPRYEAEISLTEDLTDLGNRVRLPLLWLRDGGLWDDVRSSLNVTITHQGKMFYSDSHEVTIPPAHEWTDTDESRQWLPSFIFPGDSLIARVVGKGRRYLIGATGNGHSAFDGYQQVPGTKPREAAWEIVDRQAQAIWNALTFDFRFSYSNPPPTFARDAQRLRSPSQIARDRDGTCIDLALLYAACLEKVGIYAVIFLLDGHAFPGYWRSENAHAKFEIAEGHLDHSGQQIAQVDQQKSWLLAGDGGYNEVVHRIRSGELVPVESVWMTMERSFEDAVDEGVRNLRNSDEFDSLIDVKLARAHQVTPLPIRGLLP